MTTSSPFDLLGSASFLVDDAVATTASLVDALGFPAPKPHWILPLGPTGMSARFLRPLHDTVQCPTPIELVEATPIAPDLPLEASQVQIHAIRRSQEARPVRAHATDVAAADALAFAARFERLGITHWVHLSPEGVPRVWVGVDPRDRTTYDPSLDAHLHIEVLPTSVLGLRPAAFDPLPFDAAAAGPGTMVRVAWRTFLVRDLDRTLGWWITSSAGSRTGRWRSARAALDGLCSASAWPRAPVSSSSSPVRDPMSRRRWPAGARARGR